MIDEAAPQTVELIYRHGTEPLVLFSLVIALMAAALALALSVGKK